MVPPIGRMGCNMRSLAVTGGLSGILGWGTYAGFPVLTGLVLGVVMALFIHKVFKIGITHGAH